MRQTSDFDLGRLLGFEAVSNEISGPVNFQDEALDAKLGAKVGAEQLVHCDITTLSPACPPAREPR